MLYNIFFFTKYTITAMDKMNNNKCKTHLPMAKKPTNDLKWQSIKLFQANTYNKFSKEFE